MAMHNGWALGAILALAALLAGCDTKPAATGTAPQGAAPEGTISDELPDMDLLPNDAPLADPADQGLVPDVSAPPMLPGDAPPEAPVPPPAAPAQTEPAVEDSIAE